MISRRDFLIRTTTSLVTGATWVSLGPVAIKIGSAQAQTRPGQVLIMCFQRGGADGLYLCAPYADPDYYTWRPDAHIVPPSGTDPDAALPLTSSNHPNYFGLNPNLAPMMEIYEDGNLAILPATHMKGSGRSHFDNQRWVGTGEIGGLTNGWMSKVLETSSSSSVFRGMMAGSGNLTAELGGADAYPAIQSADDYKLEESEWCEGQGCTENILLNHLLETYAATDKAGLPVNSLTRNRGVAMVESLQQFATLNEDYEPSAGGLEYSNSPLGRGLKLVAQLIKEDYPLECVTVNWNGGWDSHSNQRQPDTSVTESNSGLHRNQRTGSNDLLVFHRDLDSANLWPRVCMLIGTEFGRTTEQNGSFGTDHGYAACWWVMGGAVRGGEIHGDWPTLQETSLRNGRFLDAAFDCRDVMAEALVRHMEYPEGQLAQVFPGHSYDPPGIIS